MNVHGCTVRSPLTGCQVTSRPRDRFSRYSKWLDTFRTILVLLCMWSSVSSVVTSPVNGLRYGAETCHHKLHRKVPSAIVVTVRSSQFSELPVSPEYDLRIKYIAVREGSDQPQRICYWLRPSWCSLPRQSCVSCRAVPQIVHPQPHDSTKLFGEENCPRTTLSPKYRTWNTRRPALCTGTSCLDFCLKLQRSDFGRTYCLRRQGVRWKVVLHVCWIL